MKSPESAGLFIPHTRGWCAGNRGGLRWSRARGAHLDPGARGIDLRLRELCLGRHRHGPVMTNGQDQQALVRLPRTIAGPDLLPARGLPANPRAIPLCPFPSQARGIDNIVPPGSDGPCSRKTWCRRPRARRMPGPARQHARAEASARRAARTVRGGCRSKRSFHESGQVSSGS